MLNPEDLKEVGVTFDDVLLVPQYSETVPSEVDLATKLTRRITLNIPFMSAPMDTVTESKMAIALAQEGAYAIHRTWISRLKRKKSNKLSVRQTELSKPTTVDASVNVSAVRDIMEAHNVSVPVLKEKNWRASSRNATCASSKIGTRPFTTS